MDTLKKDFPIFKTNPQLVYLDSTATALKPHSVVQKLEEYYTQYSANIFRGVYKISEKATQEYEATRVAVARFLHASRPEEVVFTGNTTGSLNLIAYSLGRQIVDEKSEVVTTIMEHHSNFVPWQVLSQESGSVLKVIDIDENGYLQGTFDKFASLEEVVTKKTKILTLTYVSNVLGTVNPIKEIVSAAKRLNPELIVVVDAAQAVPHMKVDVQDLGADLVAFSSHKMLGPTGVGVLWGKYEILEKMYPFMYGGEMINGVYIDHSEYKLPPHKFEAGTPMIGEVIALRSAVEYLESVGMAAVQAHEQGIVEYAFQRFVAEFGSRLKIYGPQNSIDRGGVLAFTLKGCHPHDVAQILDEENVAIRAGHHCAMPLHTRLGIGASCRASFYVYNTKEDVDSLVTALQKVEKILK